MPIDLDFPPLFVTITIRLTNRPFQSSFGRLDSSTARHCGGGPFHWILLLQLGLLGIGVRAGRSIDRVINRSVGRRVNCWF
jgi:hypothetical protein